MKTYARYILWTSKFPQLDIDPALLLHEYSLCNVCLKKNYSQKLQKQFNNSIIPVFVTAKHNLKMKSFA